MKTRVLPHLVEKGRKLRLSGRSWSQVSIALQITTEDGRPNPGLAKRIIADGYIPRLPETCIRLGLPAVCHVCDRKIKIIHNHQRPPWLDEAVENLRRLEEHAGKIHRSYSRNVGAG